MTTTAYHHILEGLAATGFAILDGDAAVRLRPDRWRAANVADHEIRQALGEFPRNLGVRWGVLRLRGGAQVKIAFRSSTRLAERIEEVTGLPVAGVTTDTEAPWDENRRLLDEAARGAAEKAAENRKQAELRVKREIAEQDLRYPLAGREAILAARATLTELGIAFRPGEGVHA